jgi:4-aminobutyrate aminotransferase
VSKQHIKTELPGPRARAMMERDARVVAPCYPRDYGFVMDHGKGAEVWDVDGNRFLDFMAGIAVCSTGHCHPDVVNAIKGATDKFLHISSDYWHENQVALAETMARLAPMEEDAMTFFANSGTETVEGALKLARAVTGRPRFIGFLGGFHGRTMGSLSFTSSKYTQQSGFFPTMPGVTHVPYPNNYRPVFEGADQGKAVLKYIEQLFQHNLPANEVAGMLIEPLQGEGGYIVPPEGFLKGLREICDKHGILLIFDEVQSGVGRTGKMFACQNWGVEPDIMTLAKGIGSGMPIGLIVARKSVMSQWKHGAHGNTYGGNPVACAAAIETLRLVESGYADNAAVMGEYFMGKLRDMATRFDVIGDVRGQGLMIGMELVKDRQTKEPAKTVCDELVRKAFQKGLLLLSCGVSTVRFMPPLIVDKAIIDEAMEILEASLAEVLAQQ